MTRVMVESAAGGEEEGGRNYTDIRNHSIQYKKGEWSILRLGSNQTRLNHEPKLLPEQTLVGLEGTSISQIEP